MVEHQGLLKILDVHSLYNLSSYLKGKWQGIPVEVTHLDNVFDPHVLSCAVAVSCRGSCGKSS